MWDSEFSLHTIQMGKKAVISDERHLKK